MSEPSRFPRWHSSAALLAALMLLQAPLWINPGYFSHDELQWAARAATARVGELPFVAFTDTTWFQFRPLTFNLWLLLSHVLFESPRLFHAVFVLLGAINALLLADVLRRVGCRAAVAFAAALVFGLSPFAVWVQGWVGCLADLLWVGFGLGVVAVLQRLHTRSSKPIPPKPSQTTGSPCVIPAKAGIHLASIDKIKMGPSLRWDDGEGKQMLREAIWLAALTAALATTLALLSKEAALSIPALLALGTVLLGAPRTWLVATLASSLVTLGYLALRLDTLTTPGEATSYALHATALPSRWLEYMAFPWALGVQEIHVLRLSTWSEWIVLALAPLALTVCLWRASWRLGLTWLAGGVLALAPVLALPLSANQYGYGFAALGCGVAALAWERLHRRGRVVLAVLAVVAVAHGFQIQLRMLEVGRLQAVFSPALAEQAQTHPQGTITLWPERAAHRPIYARLSHDIPAWRDVPLGARVRMAGHPSQATHIIAPDGRVRPRETTP